jgi:acetyl-CoA C-acetyltransferase
MPMSKTVVITSASRTAVGSLGRSLKNIPGDDLGSSVILSSIEKSKIKKEDA